MEQRANEALLQCIFYPTGLEEHYRRSTEREEAAPPVAINKRAPHSVGP
jgi:hypothetical protein